jgi:hypothetical protein
MVDVTTLSADAEAPIGDFRRWVTSADLGNALARAMGRPIATWYWCFIPPGLRIALRTYCSGKSARVFIRTEDDPSLSTSAVFEAAMIWPDNEGLYNQDEFRIVFRDLVEQVST